MNLATAFVFGLVDDENTRNILIDPESISAIKIDNWNNIRLYCKDICIDFTFKNVQALTLASHEFLVRLKQKIAQGAAENYQEIDYDFDKE